MACFDIDIDMLTLAVKDYLYNAGSTFMPSLALALALALALKIILEIIQSTSLLCWKDVLFLY